MKTMNKYFLGLAVGALALSLNSCDDFEDINKNPSAVSAEYVQADWFLANSFGPVQQNPNDNERVFVYNWASITRVIGDNTFGCAARYNDEYNGCLYNFSASSIKYATKAIELVDENEAAGVYSTPHDKKWNSNVREMARIWRVMCIADFVDCFGPYPIEAFQGENPKFNSIQEVYYWFFEELADAQSKLTMDVELTDTDKKQDVAFNGDAAKWQKLANSLRLRYAMRLSEIDAAKAKAEFEAAVATGKLMLTNDDILVFPTAGGWSNWENVYNRGWDDDVISSSMINILSGLGGVKVADCYNAITGSSLDVTQYVKPMNYIGIEYKDHYPANTDNPMQYQWLDGIPENVDPRSFVYYCMPNDPSASNFCDKASQTVLPDNYQGMRDADGNYVWGKEVTTMAFNGPLAGVRPAWTDTYSRNYLHYYSWNTCPFLAKKYNQSYANDVDRVWFGPWETHFLLAEAALYGWNTGGKSAKDEYETGIKVDFDYLGIGAYADAYINSEDYNRVGTSVKFEHTTEPVAFTASYYNGYENQLDEDGVVSGRGAVMSKTYNYPDANKILYKGKKLNDKLTKIITQKFVAQVPYVVVEMWNDRRRLGLPFFEVPGADKTLSGSDFDNDKTNGYSPTDKSLANGQKWNMFTQRMRYPVSLENADPEEYQHALELLGGGNFMTTPLWWAIH